VYDLLLFDLDGTLCDPIDGISRCINYALTHHGFNTVEPKVVAELIGPPLDIAFETILGTRSATLIDKLIETFRERYTEVGYAECSLYPGVAESLRELSRGPIPLAVCTSKRSDFAERILHMFELGDLFQFINGGEVPFRSDNRLSTSARRVAFRPVRS
jgi:phosphoglycolate phosphatase